MFETNMRRITLQDVPALSFIAQKTFYDTFTGTCTDDDMSDFLQRFYSEEILLEEVKNPAFQYFFIEINDNPAGYILFADADVEFDEIKGSSALELKRFYILEEYHGKGLAQKMMHFLVDHAVSEGYDCIFLGVWEHNLKAQKFYKKFEFKLTSHTHDFPIGNTPQTDVYMWKSIN